MILADYDLIEFGSTLIEPFDVNSVQPSSYDLTLDDKLLEPLADRIIDLRVDDPQDHMKEVGFTSWINNKRAYVLLPQACVLGSTKEVIKCPHNLSARIEGKSSLGRLFMAVHITAGVIDSGWQGQITLEIVNHGPWEVILWPGMKIAQISYLQLTQPCKTPYGSASLQSHYFGQRGPTAAVGRRGT